MFTTALFATAKIWKQCKYLWTDEWIKKIYKYIHNSILFSHNKEQNFAIYDNLNGSWVHYASGTN